MYLDSDDKPRPRNRAGAWAAGVPGTVRGLGLAHARWGKLAWADLVQPAARLAREGFPISADLAGSLNSQLGEQKNTKTGHRDDRARLADFTESVSAFARPDGAAWKAGDRLIQSDLAATLQRIAAAGPDEFYTGRTAQLIARYMEEKDGRITADDLTAYQARLRPQCTPRSAAALSGAWALPRQEASFFLRCSTSSSGSTSRPTVHRLRERCIGSPRPCDGLSSPGPRVWETPISWPWRPTNWSRRPRPTSSPARSATVPPPAPLWPPLRSCPRNRITRPTSRRSMPPVMPWR